MHSQMPWVCGGGGGDVEASIRPVHYRLHLKRADRFGFTDKTHQRLYFKNQKLFRPFLSLALLLNSITLGEDGDRFSVIFVGQDCSVTKCCWKRELQPGLYSIIIVKIPDDTDTNLRYMRTMISFLNKYTRMKN